MGKHTDKFLANRADQLRLCVYANLAVVGACLADYVLFKHPYVLETLAVLVGLINGFAIWQQRYDFNEARERDLDEEIGKERADDARNERLRLRDFR